MAGEMCYSAQVRFVDGLYWVEPEECLERVTAPEIDRARDEARRQVEPQSPPCPNNGICQYLFQSDWGPWAQQEIRVPVGECTVVVRLHVQYKFKIGICLDRVTLVSIG